MAVDEEPVADHVDQVRGDQGDGDGTDVVEGLEIAPEGEIEEERGGAVVESAEEGDRAVENSGVDGKAEHEKRGAEDDENQGEGEARGKEEAVEEPSVGFVEATGPMRLGEVGVEAEEDTGDTEGDGVVEDLAEGCGGDGECGIGHVSDHDGVHDAHGHPAEFGEDERKGEGEHGPDLLANGHHVSRGNLGAALCCR